MNELVTLQQKTELAIRQETKELIQSSIADSTIKRYQRLSRELEAWLRGQILTDGLLAVYITEFHTAGKSSSTIAQVVAAAKWLAKNHGIEIVGEITSKTLAAIRRKGKERGKGQTGMILTASDRVIFDMVIAFHLIESDSVITMSSLNGTGGCMKPVGS